AWFDGLGCDAWVLRAHTEDAATYALKRAGERTDTPEEAARFFDAWMAYAEREGIEAVSFGVITLRRARGRSNWVQGEALPPVVGACGAAIEQRFLRRDFLDARRDDRALLTCRLRPADRLRWDLEHTLSGGAWTVVESHLRHTDGLATIATMDAEIVRF